jgi:hypothetical protein
MAGSLGRAGPIYQDVPSWEKFHQLLWWTLSALFSLYQSVRPSVLYPSAPPYVCRPVPHTLARPVPALFCPSARLSDYCPSFFSFRPPVYMSNPYFHTFAYSVPAFVYRFVRLCPSVRLSVSPFQKFVHRSLRSVSVSGCLSDCPLYCRLSVCSSKILPICGPIFLPARVSIVSLSVCQVSLSVCQVSLSVCSVSLSRSVR